MASPKQLTDLPSDIIGSIVEQADGDFESILKLANSNKDVSVAVQEWHCAKCQDSIFLLPSDDDGTNITLPPNAKPFICGVCNGKFCGQEGYDKRFCKADKCHKCGKFECHKCMCSHLEDCGACGRRYWYCKECQGPVVKERTCDFCRFPFCQHHGDKCETCGLVTCGIHDCGPTQCDTCKKAYCERCGGNQIFYCFTCRKASCGAASCPTFSFDDRDTPVCSKCE